MISLLVSFDLLVTADEETEFQRKNVLTQEVIEPDTEPQYSGYKS